MWSNGLELTAYLNGLEFVMIYASASWMLGKYSSTCRNSVDPAEFYWALFFPVTDSMTVSKIIWLWWVQGGLAWFGLLGYSLTLGQCHSALITVVLWSEFWSQPLSSLCLPSLQFCINMRIGLFTSEKTENKTPVPSWQVVLCLERYLSSASVTFSVVGEKMPKQKQLKGVGVYFGSRSKGQSVMAGKSWQQGLPATGHMAPIVRKQTMVDASARSACLFFFFFPPLRLGLFL